MTEEDCVFCKIIEGELPYHKIYEDEDVLVFLDANPVSKGHSLVIPKEHVTNIREAEGMDYMWDAIVNTANAIEEAFNAEGFNIDSNDGEIAGQEVFHLHFHVTPRYEGDEIEIEYNRKELDEGDEIADDIRSEMT